MGDGAGLNDGVNIRLPNHAANLAADWESKAPPCKVCGGRMAVRAGAFLLKSGVKPPIACVNHECAAFEKAISGKVW